MSEQELVQCETMLKGLLLNDNTERNKAQSQLQNCLSNIKNKEALSLYCSILLLKSSDLNVQTYCSLILRKIFLTSEKEISNEAVKNFSNENKSEIKKNLLLSMQSAKNKSLQKKIAEACIKVYEGLIENEEKWDEFLKFIINLFSLELIESNYSNIELGLYLLSNIYSFAYDQLNEGINIFLKNFKNYFSCDSLSLKAKTVECVVELLCSASSKKEVKLFKDFIFNLLQTTKLCLDQKDQDNLKICLESLQDLSISEPKILRKNFDDIFILMGKIIEEKDFEENIREIGLEILVSLIEKMKKIINDDKLKIFIQCLFKYAMELDQIIDDEWLHPNSVSFISDEFIPEHKLDEACSLLSRLFEVFGSEKMIQITSQNIIELINHSSEKEWKYKYIAYITTAEILGFIKDLASIEKLIKLIISDMNNPNVKIQYSTLYCIAEFSDTHSPDFQNTYHKQIIPEVIKILSNSKCLRVQLECCDALDCFIEHMTSGDAALYMKDSLESLFNVFIRNEVESPPALKEGILDVLQEFINASEDEFKNYSDKCLQLLLQYLGEILNKNINRNLIGPLMETISCIGPLCPELFKKHLTLITNTLVQINLNLTSFTDDIANYLLSTWEKIIPYLKENDSATIPKIISSLIELLKKNPEMSISSNPDQKIDVMAFFSEEKKEEEKKEKAKTELKTSETEEFSIFIEILNTFLSDCSELCLKDHINSLIPVSIKLLKYPNTDIQSEISKTLSHIIEILSKQKENVNELQNYSKNFISEIISQLLEETDFSLISSFCDTIKEIIQNTKLFLTTPEINNLSQKILEVFDKVEKSRIALLKQKEEKEQEYEKDKKTGDGKIYSDDEDDDESKEEEVEGIKDQIDEIENLLTSFSEFFGVLFNTHKKYTLEVVDKIIKDYLPKYFSENSSSFEKNLGIILLDDMAEFLQQDLLSNIWDNICEILIKYSNNKDEEVRNSACYGLGVFSQYTSTNYSKYYKSILTNLVNAINIPIDKQLPKNAQNDLKFARDNAVSALGKILKYHQNELGPDYDNFLDIWINAMPITQDDKEGKFNNEFLLDILMKDQNKVLGNDNKNLKQIIIILSKAYNHSEMSDDIMNSNIKQFANGVKNNAEYNKILMDLINKQKGKTLNKIKSLFEI